MDSSDLVLDYAIDSLKVGQKISSSGIGITGWVIGRNSKVATVQVLHKNQLLCTIPIGQTRLDVAKVYPEIPGTLKKVALLVHDRHNRLV